MSDTAQPFKSALAIALKAMRRREEPALLEIANELESSASNLLGDLEASETLSDRLASELGRTRKRETFARAVAEERIGSHHAQHAHAEIEKVQSTLKQIRSIATAWRDSIGMTDILELIESHLDPNKKDSE